MILPVLFLAGNVRSASIELDLSTPKKTALSFCASIQSQKWADAARCVENGSVARAQSLIATFPKGGVMKLTLKDLTSETQAATATVTGNLFYSLSAPGKAKVENTYYERLELKLVGKNWLIVGQKLPPSTGTTSPLGGIASILAHGMASTGAGANTPAAGIANPQTQTVSNLKQLAVAVMIYAADYDDLMPKANWQSSLRPYVKSDAVFKSPMSTAAKPSGYSFNSALFGINLAKLADPAKTVLIYEGKNNVLSFLYSGKAAVAYADAHVKLIDKTEAAKLRWKP